MCRICLVLVVVLFFISPGFSQKEASVWYFGNHAGLDFSSGSPVVLTDGQIETYEGVASICDAQGKLLFYTEGTTVWNAQHTVMPNGRDLLGHLSSSQSSVIVPKINDPQRYYVFTIAQLGSPDGFNYSIVNMALDNGRGDVEIKNVPLQSPVCEKLTAVKHCNGRDMWVIVHGYNSATFHAYLVTTAGVGPVPVISTAGSLITNSNPENTIGCMKTSPNGKKLAIAHRFLGAELFDFNNATGQVSNGGPLFLPTENYGSYRGAYGVEFSPDSKLLYVSADYFDFDNIQETSILLQYNVSLPGLAAVQSSKHIVYKQQAHWSTENFGTLQTAPDGKIYMAEFSQPFISVINYPNLPGAACQFVHAQLQTSHINGGWSTYGLPAFIQSYSKQGYSFRGACSGSTLFFDYERSAEELSVKWDFGDPASGPNNISILDSSRHVFSSEGIYTVKLIRVTACGSDTVSKLVNVGVGNFNLGSDTTLCGTSQFIINPGIPEAGNSYLWQDNTLNSSFTATQSGLYWVEVKNNINDCSKRDSIVLIFKPDPQFDLGEDIDKCEGEPVTVSAAVTGGSFLWSNGSAGNSLQITQSGKYWLRVSLDGCVRSDTIKAVFHQYPVVDLGKDTVLCEGELLLLNAQNPGMQYQWQDHTTGPAYTVNSPGTYWTIVNNNNCFARDTISVNYLSGPVFTLGGDAGICQGMSLKLSPEINKGSGFTYLWSTGISDTSITITQQGSYALTLSNRCGTETDEIKIVQGVCEIYVPNAFTPNGDGLNDVLKAMYGDNVTEFNFQVYNRWGENVFTSKDIKKGWDGTYKGKMQDNGLFVWLIRYKTPGDTSNKLIKGTLLLIR